MHAVLIKFCLRGSLRDLDAFFEDRGRALEMVPGFLTTTWIADDDIMGAFMIFQDRVSAEEYLHSDAAEDVFGNSALDHVSVQRFEVVRHATMPAPPTAFPVLTAVHAST